MSTKKKTKKKTSLKDYWKNKGKKQAIGSAIDLGGAVIGGAIGAAFGKTAFWVGLGTIVTGHLIGEKGKIVQSLGVGATAYGIASQSLELANAKQAPVSGLGSTTEGIKRRLTLFKDNLLHATFLDKLVGKKEDTDTGDDSIEGIDTSELDAFENYGERQAYLQAIIEEQENSDSLDIEQELLSESEVEPLEELEEEYTEYEEFSPMEIDFSTI